MISFLFLGIIFVSWTHSAFGGSCGEKKYECRSGNKCIPENWLCDEEIDCTDGDDEINCSNDCDSDAFKCLNNSQCIRSTWRCDGEEDCKDGSDEDNCDASIHCPDDGSHFSCGVLGLCISIDSVCDNHWDCPKGEDEDSEYCSNRTCRDSDFKCEADHYCINKRWVCDGNPDCLDGLDEKNCEPLECNVNEFTCLGGIPICLDSRMVCDGSDDCDDGSDEALCNNTRIHCPDGEGLCRFSKECIPMPYFCDGKFDCLDETDEIDCNKIECLPIEFKCVESKSCLPSWMICNGEMECSDGSDEKSCASLPVRTCDRHKEFNCTGTKDSICIPNQKLCDGHADCPNLEDESDAFCFNQSMCGMPCKHGQCVVSDGKAKCVCNEGFDWSVESHSCQDVNECLNYGTCGQICTNKIGGFKCSCNPHYELDGLDHRICRSKDGEPLLLFVAGKELRYVELRRHSYEPLVKLGGQVKAFDLGIQSGNIFLSDYSSGSIYRVDRRRPDDPKLIWKGYGPHTVENMAYDWVYQNLYVVTHHQIDMLHFSQRGGEVYLKNVAKCSQNYYYFGLVVDPRKGQNYLYWIVAGRNSSIMRASLDGSVVSTFVGSNVLNSISLTIDFETNSLYWVDTKHYSIFRRSLNVNDDKIDNVFSSYTYLRQPLSIDFFESHLFWSLMSGRVHRLDVTSQPASNPYNKTTTTIRDGLSHLMVVKVAHVLRQPIVDRHACSDHKCSHMCLPSPFKDDAHVCLCPDAVHNSMDRFKPGVEGVECIRYSSIESQTQRGLISLISGIIFLLILTVTLVILMIRKKLRRQNIKAMNFTNPVYKKQQTDDDFSIFRRNQSISATDLLHVSESQGTMEATSKSEFV